jgi:hypothetical protein
MSRAEFSRALHSHRLPHRRRSSLTVADNARNLSERWAEVIIGVGHNRGGMAKRRGCTIAEYGLLMRLVQTASRALEVRKRVKAADSTNSSRSLA